MGILYGKSDIPFLLRICPFPFSNFTVEIKGKKLITSKIYSKVGIYDEMSNCFYTNQKTNARKYGYRKRFEWENLEEGEWEQNQSISTIERTSYQPPEEIVQIIYSYIINKNYFEKTINVCQEIRKQNEEMAQNMFENLRIQSLICLISFSMFFVTTMFMYLRQYFLASFLDDIMVHLIYTLKLLSRFPHRQIQFNTYKHIVFIFI